MPTTRKRLERRRSDILSPNQRSILETGVECFPAWPGFEDEDHRREAWAANRAQIMAEWRHPGRRPDAYWEFDLQLEECRRDGHRTWGWPAPIQSEPEMVLDLLKRGELKSCQFSGAHRIESELRAIGENWLNEVRITVSQAGGVPKIATALPTWGTPVWFYQEHAPGICAALQGP